MLEHLLAARRIDAGLASVADRALVARLLQTVRREIRRELAGITATIKAIEEKSGAEALGLEDRRCAVALLESRLATAEGAVLYRLPELDERA